MTLIVGVGSKTKSFSVHKNILSQTSSFFKAACKPEWMKPEDRVIRFPDDDVEAIRVMVYWMYSDELCVHQKHLDDFAYWTQPAQDAMKTHWGLFAKLYVIGDKYAIPRLQNHCIDAMLQSRHKNLGIICPAIIPFVYENTSSPSDPLRRLLVMAFRSDCQAWSFQRFIVGNTGICTDFFVDLAAEFFRDKDESQSTYSTYTATLEQPQVDFCKKFHKHNEGIPACNQFHKYHIIGRSDKAEAADATEEDMGAKTSGSMEPVVID